MNLTFKILSLVLLAGGVVACDSPKTADLNRGYSSCEQAHKEGKSDLPAAANPRINDRDKDGRVC